MIDLLELAHAISEIASCTEEADTARRLMDQVDRLLTTLGLPHARGRDGVRRENPVSL